MSNLFKQIWNDIDTNLYLYSDHNYRYGPPTRTEYRLIVENLSSRISWQVRIPPVLFWVNHHSITFHSGSWTWSSHSDESWADITLALMFWAHIDKCWGNFVAKWSLFWRCYSSCMTTIGHHYRRTCARNKLDLETETWNLRGRSYISWNRRGENVPDQLLSALEE